MAVRTKCEAGQQVNNLTFQSDHSCALCTLPWSFTAVPYLIVVELKILFTSCLKTKWYHYQCSHKVLQWPSVFDSLDSHGFLLFKNGSGHPKPSMLEKT